MSKQTTKLGAVEHAHKTLHELEAKRGAIAASGQNDQSELESVAFAAHTGDQKAAAKLETLKERALRRDLELKSVDAAIAVAKQNVETAKQAEAQTQARKVARELLKRARVIVEHARTLDDANAIRVEASRAIADELTEMRSLAHGIGLFVPSHEQLFAMASRADQTATMQTPWAREVGEHLPPNQRRDHMSYAQSWHVAITKAAAALLDEDKQTEAA